MIERLIEEALAGIFDKPRWGRPVEIDGTARANIIALACSAPPEGRARWDLRLLADKAVKLGYCEHISHTHVSTVLKKRAEAAPEKAVVYWTDHLALHRQNGASFSPLQPPIRPE